MKTLFIAVALLVAVVVTYIVTVQCAKEYTNSVLRILEFVVTAIVFYYFGRKVHEKELIEKSVVTEGDVLKQVISRDLKILSTFLIITGISICLINYLFNVSILPIVEILWIIIALIIYFM